MKSISSIAACIAAVSAIGAQPVVNASDVTHYLPSETLTAHAESFNPGKPGADKTWDFSHLQWLPAGTNDLMRATDIASRNPYPDATHALVYTNQPREGIQFWRHSQNKLECIGQSFDGIGPIDMTAHATTLATFPYTYQTVIKDGSGPDATAITSTYDSYGTLVMPYGTHRNVIRQKIVQAGQTDYIWFNTSPFYPILQTNMAKHTLGAMMNTDLPARDFTIDETFWIAEPCTGLFTVSLQTDSKVNVCVQDVSGKTKVAATVQGSATLDLRHCDAGIYLVGAEIAGQYHIRKIVKSSSAHVNTCDSGPCLTATAQLSR